jgi:hypothetical protein
VDLVPKASQLRQPRLRLTSTAKFLADPSSVSFHEFREVESVTADEPVKATIFPTAWQALATKEELHQSPSHL